MSVLEPGQLCPRRYDEIGKLTKISFADLKLAPEILKALTESGYTTPTPIQAQAIPLVLEGILLETMYELPGLEGVEEAVISREVVEGEAKPLLIYADHDEKPSKAKVPSSA